MNKNNTLLQLAPLALAVMAQPPGGLGVSLLAADAGYQMVERGEDFAVLRKLTATTSAAGKTTFHTNQFTLLENCLNYFENGQWKLSEDLIEPFPDGAIAQRGPNKAIFSPNLNSQSVFDIQTSDGKRLRGGVRVIQLTDIATGRSSVLATVKASAPGELVPPNSVVYRDAFDGLKADVVLVWKHNYFGQDVVFREQPQLPAGMSPDTSRLEIVSEMVEAPQPSIRKQMVQAGNAGQLEDDVVINFGRLAIVMGKAYPVQNDVAWAVGGLNPSDDSSPVLKQWHTLPDGRMFLIESIGWTDAQPHLKQLPTATQARATPASKEKTAVARLWPEQPVQRSEAKPLELARLSYQPKGYVVDFVIIPEQAQPTTFLSGTTYYIRTNYYTGNTITFQPGCTVKYKNNAYLLLYGDQYFPAAGQLMPVFTSRNDDKFGEKIAGVQGEADSDGDPTQHKAAQAIWIYYVNFTTWISDVRIRWAQKGIQYDSNLAVDHHVNDSLFQECAIGIQANITGGTLYLTNVKKCNVTAPVLPPTAPVSGSMTEDCGPLYTVASFAGINQQEADRPPDTMGVVGPSHFMVMVNRAVAVYDKYSAVRRSPTPATSLSDFLTVTVSSGPYAGTYPTGATFDPRVVYDHVSQRWIACALDAGSWHVLLAVSRNSNPVGNGGPTWVSDNWIKYLVPFGPCNTDYDTLGVDGNGIYIAVRQTGGCGAIARVAALPKGPFLDGSAQTVQSNYILDVTEYGSVNLFSAVNFDPVAIDDPAWFVFDGYSPGPTVFYNQLKWVHGFTGAPEWQLQPPPYWGELTVSPSYYDLNNGAIKAPQLGSTYVVNLPHQGSRLMMAMARKIGGTQYLWTCHQIGVNRFGNNDDGQADRSAVEWIKIQTTPSVSIVSSNRIYDNAVTNPKFYYIPSLAVNKNGDMLVGFSGSSVNDYIGAYYTGTLNNGASPAAPVRYFAGKDWYNSSSGFFTWGDYSYTSLDPDGLTLWMIQEYAETRYDPNPNFVNAWGTRIVAVTPF